MVAEGASVAPTEGAVTAGVEEVGDVAVPELSLRAALADHEQDRHHPGKYQRPAAALFLRRRWSGWRRRRTPSGAIPIPISFA